LKNDLTKIITKYKNKGSAMIFKIENDADTDKILTYSGILNGGLSAFFVAVELDKPLGPYSLDLLKNHIELIGRYDHMQGQSFVLFYTKFDNEWYKLSIDQLKTCWKSRKSFSQNSITRVKKTVYGPDFLNKIYMPFKVVENDDENDPTAVFK